MDPAIFDSGDRYVHDSAAQLLRPTFAQALDPPLVQLCRFISYERIREAFEKAGEFISAMKADELLNRLAVSFEGDFLEAYKEAL